MDTESQKRFDEITAKDASALTPADVDFLRARSSYLSGDQLEKYEDVLEDDKPATKPLARMNLEELKVAAAEKGIEVSDDEKKADLIAKLEAAQ